MNTESVPGLGRFQICFVVGGLGLGGSERQLVMLATRLSQRGLRVVVVTFYSGPLRAALEANGICVLSLERRGRHDVVPFLLRFRNLMLNLSPEIVYSMLSTPNLVCLLSRWQPVPPKLVWGLRGSERDLSSHDLITRGARQVQVPLARHCDLVILNSRAGFRHYARAGIPSGSMVVIPNGIDTDYFTPGLMIDRAKLRQAWGLGPDERAIAIVANLELVKGHDLLLSAYALAEHGSESRLVLVGARPSPARIRLQQAAKTLGIADRMIWLEPQTNIRAVYSAIDVLVSSSYSEGFSNVIGEAMACGLPCIATDVGDSADILGDTGITVPPGDVRALAAALSAVLTWSPSERRVAGARARKRVACHFPPQLMVSRTIQALSPLSPSLSNL